MTRIVAGTARGRRLRVPKDGTRPTADRVREAMFASLDHLLVITFTKRSVDALVICSKAYEGTMLRFGKGGVHTL